MQGTRCRDQVRGVLAVAAAMLAVGCAKPQVREGQAPVFSLAEVELTQDSISGAVTVSYQVTNLSERRASGRVCVRLYGEDTFSYRSLASSNSGDFNLAPGASKKVSAAVTLEDESVWGRTRQLKVYSGRYGCISDVEESESAVLTLGKPESILPPPEFIPDAPPAGAGK